MANVWNDQGTPNKGVASIYARTPLRTAHFIRESLFHGGIIKIIIKSGQIFEFWIKLVSLCVSISSIFSLTHTGLAKRIQLYPTLLDAVERCRKRWPNCNMLDPEFWTQGSQTKIYPESLANKLSPCWRFQVSFKIIKFWFSLAWSTAMFFNDNKRKRLRNNRVKFLEDLVRAPTWPPFLCLGAPTWRPWRHVKTENRVILCDSKRTAVPESGNCNRKCPVSNGLAPCMCEEPWEDPRRHCVGNSVPGSDSQKILQIHWRHAPESFEHRKKGYLFEERLLKLRLGFPRSPPRRLNWRGNARNRSMQRINHHHCYR